ncbi:tyrosine-protein phosphatase [Catenovulum agarivorans]|uniref:tyrosine-protein phosphatase n=1 Tax=Catenovulum agarivorans TaxID=1172192 RepID=UPI0003181A90|nr:CpsB/CapC family capsule biosynthesis tyrosine phosphatase [Catenovulum agarivorans]
MIDIHSHILPGVDDGAQTLTEALDMLKMAIDQGVTTQVLTPHIHFGRYNNNKQQLLNTFNKFKEAVDKKDLQINLLLAAECRIGPELMQLVAQQAIPWLGEYQQKRTFLLEFPRTDVPYGSDNLVRWLISKNCLPVIVHPERNNTFLTQRHKLQTFIDLGCPLQITASSITGKFGAEAQKLAEDLLVNNQVSAIASDCHNLKGRKPDLLSGFNKAAEVLGQTQSETITQLNPAKLIA